MTTPVRKCAEQAGLLMHNPQNTPTKLDKFAELLIRECLEIISDESEKVPEEWRCKDGNHIWWKIKEHFGVDE